MEAMVMGCTRLCDVELLFFFFQAEDGIRDLTVTGVQTCALPISVELLVLQPTRDLSVLAAGRERLLPPSVRRIVRAMGGQREAASDFLGFLLFHPEHTGRLAEAGYEDVRAQWPAIGRFFEKLERVTVAGSTP